MTSVSVAKVERIGALVALRSFYEYYSLGAAKKRKKKKQWVGFDYKFREANKDGWECVPHSVSGRTHVKKNS